MAFGDYQIEIYLQGLAGIVPSLALDRTTGGSSRLFDGR